MLNRMNAPGIVKPGGVDAGWDASQYGTVVFHANENSGLTGTTDVTQWDDLSGSANHATIGAGGGVDSTARTINSKRVLTMAACNGMACGSANPVAQGCLLVAMTAGAANNQEVCGNANGVSSGSNGAMIRWQGIANPVRIQASIQNGAAVQADNAVIQGYTSGPAAPLVVFAMNWDASGVEYDGREDGASAAGTDPGLVISTTDQAQIYIGGHPTSTFDGDIAELVVWTTKLTNANVNIALDTVATRWGLALP